MLNYEELSPTEKIVFLERMLDTYKLSYDYYSEDANELLKSGKLYSKETYIVMNKLDEIKEVIDADFYSDDDE
jgi:hypothetical protein